MVSTLTSKGQVTIPKAVRDYLGLRPGNPVEFEIDPSGRAVVRPARQARRRGTRSRVAKLRGTLKTGRGTDALMELLRDHGADARDPGFGGTPGP